MPYLDENFTILLILISSTILTGATKEQLEIIQMIERRNIQANKELAECKRRLNNAIHDGAEYQKALLATAGQQANESFILKYMKRLIELRNYPPKLQLVAFNLFNELSSFKTLSKIALKANSIRFEVLPENVYVNVITDMTLLQEILVNLLIGTCFITVGLDTNLEFSYSSTIGHEIFNEKF